LIDLNEERGLLSRVLGERGAALFFREIQAIAFAERARLQSETENLVPTQNSFDVCGREKPDLNYHLFRPQKTMATE
jgi:hypothetical protein